MVVYNENGEIEAFRSNMNVLKSTREACKEEYILFTSQKGVLHDEFVIFATCQAMAERLVNLAMSRYKREPWMLCKVVAEG